jgi:hypothetical protein
MTQQFTFSEGKARAIGETIGIDWGDLPRPVPSAIALCTPRSVAAATANRRWHVALGPTPSVEPSQPSIDRSVL